MASDSRSLAVRQTRRRRAQAAVAALLLAAATAQAMRTLDSPRWLVGCAIVALAAVAWGWAALARLSVPPPAPEPADLAFGRSQEALVVRAALTQAQLDQAPVALWWQNGGGVEPLNNAARRLVAPGGASAPDELLARLLAAPSSDRRQLLAFDSERGPERCLLATRALVVEGSEARLLALMPIESELEAQTLKAWRQLVHVLTHEIMNSLTPIASLSSTAHEMIAQRLTRDDVDAAADAATREDLAVALETIARRTESLATFVAEYRRVSDWPEPTLAAVALAPLFARVERLVAADWRARGGAARFAVAPETLTLMADGGQLEQALLNLLSNAAHATVRVGEPQVVVSARLIRGGRLAIEVRDNGPGVPHGLEQDIFMPFFSTREHGSGIGLAVVRNLVQGMGGSVRHVKPASGGAAFVLSF
jgi:signal transduction histidine kinase